MRRRLLFSSASWPCYLTRREVLFFLGILVILLGGLAGPVSHYLAQAQIERAVTKAREIDLFLRQSATDNDDTWPVGQGTSAVGTSEGIARNLLKDQYASDPGIFALTSPTYRGTAPDFSDFGAGSIDWDFTAGATAATGLTASAPDLLPTVYCTGESVVYPQAGPAGLTLSGAGPFGKSGIVVGNKAGGAVFLRGVEEQGQIVAPGFFPSGYAAMGICTQIRPGRK